MDRQHFDVIIVGASLSGSYLATLYARQGLSVALVERRQSEQAYKSLCTHLLHPAALRILTEENLLDELLTNGGLLTKLKVSCHNVSLTYPFRKHQSMANIERAILDPAIRQRAIEQPGVTYLPGTRVTDLLKTRTGQICGVRAIKDHDTLELSATLTVGADGRASPTADFANIQSKAVPTNRTSIFAYYHSISDNTDSRIWVNERGKCIIAAFPNKNRTLISAYLDNQYLQFQGHESAKEHFENHVVNTAQNQIPLGSRIGQIMSTHTTQLLWRPHQSLNMTLVGDAFLSPDPLTGLGCSWALESAQRLAQATIPSLKRSQMGAHQDLNAALRRYRHLHFRKYVISAYVQTLLSTRSHWLTHPLFTKTLPARRSKQ